METVPGFRPYYQCPCGAYRWQRSAANKGETHCLQCGTPFTGAQLRFWPKSQRLGGPRGHMPSTTMQQYGGQQPAWEYMDAKGAGGKGAKGTKGAKGAYGPQQGKGGRGQRPLQQPGLLTASATGGGNRGAAGTAQAAPNVINYSRASKDALYKARTHYKMVHGLWGEGHAYTVAAQQGLAEAEKEAMQKQPPEKKLAALRLEHGRVLDTVERQLRRCDEIELQQLALQQEYYDLEEEAAKNGKRAEELQSEIDAQEANLPEPAEPGAQRGLRDQLHSVLQAHTRRHGRDFSTRKQRRVVDDLEELLKNFENSEVDEDMGGEISDSLPSTPNMSDGEAKEKPPKQRKARGNRPPAQEAATDDDGEWQKGLGAVGRKLARRGDLGKRTVLQIAARQAGQGGKAKGKGADKGKGKANSYLAAVQAPARPPTTTYASAAAAGADGAAGGQPMSSSAGQPSTAVPPGGVPAGGNLTGGWPNLGAHATASAPAAQVPVPAMDFCAHQAELRRGGGSM